MPLIALAWYSIVFVGMFAYAVGVMFLPKKAWVSKASIGWAMLAGCLIAEVVALIFLYQTGKGELLKTKYLFLDAFGFYLSLLVVSQVIHRVSWRSVKIVIILFALVFSYLRVSVEWGALRSSFLDHKGVWGYICPSVLGPFEDGVIPERFSRYYSQEEPLYGFWYRYYRLERSQRRDQICAEFKKEVETEK